MAQLHFSVPDVIEQQLRRKAEEANLPLSKFLAQLVKREVEPSQRWPEGYLESLLGKWEGDLEWPAQESPEKRLSFDE